MAQRVRWERVNQSIKSGGSVWYYKREEIVVIRVGGECGTKGGRRVWFSESEDNVILTERRECDIKGTVQRDLRGIKSGINR